MLNGNAPYFVSLILSLVTLVFTYEKMVIKYTLINNIMYGKIRQAIR